MEEEVVISKVTLVDSFKGVDYKLNNAEGGQTQCRFLYVKVGKDAFNKDQEGLNFKGGVAVKRGVNLVSIVSIAVSKLFKADNSVAVKQLPDCHNVAHSTKGSVYYTGSLLVTTSQGGVSVVNIYYKFIIVLISCYYSSSQVQLGKDLSVSSK